MRTPALDAISRDVRSRDAEKEGARGPWLGSFLDNSYSQEQAGYPDAKAKLMGFSNADLERERREMLKGSFNKMFGHNAKKMLTIIEAEIAARR